MKKADVVIIGGSAAGPVAGITARRHYPDATVALVRMEQQVPIPCGIPYIYGTVGSPQKNLIPDALVTNNGMELIIDEATSIQREAKTVQLKGGESIGYDKLVLATGSVPFVPPLPGVDLEGVFSVKKDVPYLAGLLGALGSAKNAVIIGGGFIGLEMADEIRKMDVDVSVVELLPHCLSLVFDDEFCSRAHEELERRGIRTVTNSRAEAIVGNGRAKAVRLQSGEELPADLVVFGIGVRPSTDLAKNAGLKIGDLGGISVDRYMRTSHVDIFAAGDCAEKTDFFTGAPSGLRLASIATSEARIAGANLFRLQRENRGAIGVFSTKIGDLVVGMAGMRERTARSAGVDVAVGTAETIDRHPGGMPNASPLQVKLVFHRDSQKLLGGQASGGVGVGELVNVISALIQGGMTADDIATYQMGTHPALTASPIVYPLVNAAEIALTKM